MIKSVALILIASHAWICLQEILEVDIEDEKQLDDSPENFWDNR